MADQHSRDVALGRAVEYHAHTATDTPATVVETAEKFARFLAVDVIDVDDVRAWMGERAANTELAVRIATNDRPSLVAALEGEFGMLGAVLVLLDYVEPNRRIDLLMSAASRVGAAESTEPEGPTDTEAADVFVEPVEADAIVQRMNSTRNDMVDGPVSVGALDTAIRNELALHFPVMADARLRHVAAAMALRIKRDLDRF